MNKSGDKQDMILAVDVGGTKTNIGIFEIGPDKPIMILMDSYQSKKAKSLEDILSIFLSSHSMHVEAVCIGIAGPVFNGSCNATNLPWSVSEKDIRARFGWSKVKVVNDLVATSMAIPVLDEKDMFCIHEGNGVNKGNIGLISPGTGLGQALLISHDNSYIPVPSEGGHVDFAPRTESQVYLWRYLKKRFGHVSPERILSGPGIMNLYLALKKEWREKGKEIKDDVTEIKTPEAITYMALNGISPICTETMDTFLSILGAVSGNLALTALTTGGIYLGGGICPHIIPLFSRGYFTEGFTKKGRFESLMKRIPVKIITDVTAPLKGAAAIASVLST